MPHTVPMADKITTINFELKGSEKLLKEIEKANSLAIQLQESIKRINEIELSVTSTSKQG